MKLKWEEDEKKVRAYYNDKVVVESSGEFYRPSEVNLLQGDYTKARNILKWEPKVKFDKLIEIMVNEEANYLGK